MTSAFVYGVARTPFGRFGGALAGVRPDDLAATAVSAVLAKTPGLDPAAIGDVVWGNANGAGEDNRNVGRMAVLLAGLPVSVPAVTVNRLCGSSLDAAMTGSRTIESGDADIVLTGGVESMTRAPWVLPKPDRAFPAGHTTAVSTTLGWRLVNERDAGRVDGLPGRGQRAARREVRDLEGATRRVRGSLAQPGARCLGAGLLRRPGGLGAWRRAGARRGHPAGLHDREAGRAQAGFRPDGTITAANASPLNDGASAVLLGSEAARGAVGVDPIARVAGRGTFALVPQDFGIAPVEAVEQALARAGITWSDVAAVELNEAFAVQSLACIDAWKVDPEIVNTWGGAIAIGHPLGASGGRILATLAHRLRTSGDRWGVAAICIGVGQGLAVVLENVA